MLSVCDNLETFVYAANETGKTRTAAITALWFFLTRQPARVITSSSSETQLNAILWSEIRHLIATSRFPLPLLVNYLSIRKYGSAGTGEVEPLDYLIGHVTNQVESFQGHHLPNDKPRVLAIFDEASGVPGEFFEASSSWAHRTLVIGNPLSTTNFFYQFCKQGDVLDPAGSGHLLRKVIHVDGRDSPNVQLGLKWKASGRTGSPPIVIPGLLAYDDYIRRDRTYDEVQRTTRLHGRFYEGEQAMLVPNDWLDSSMGRSCWSQLPPMRKVEAIGVDVAAGGRDNTCWTLVDSHGVIAQYVADLSNTMEIAGRTIALIREHSLSSSLVAMDAGGGGKQIADRLGEQGYPVTTVGFADKSSAKQAYINRRAEIYGLLRERLKPDRDGGQFLLPPEAHQLRTELAVLPLMYDSEGRLVLPPKSRSSAKPGQTSIEKLLGRSPDRADSLALAVWILDRYAGREDTSKIVLWDDDWDRPLTPDEVDAMPQGLREIYEHEPDYDDGETWFKSRPYRR